MPHPEARRNCHIASIRNWRGRWGRKLLIDVWQQEKSSLMMQRAMKLNCNVKATKRIWLPFGGDSPFSRGSSAILKSGRHMRKKLCMVRTVFRRCTRFKSVIQLQWSTTGFVLPPQKRKQNRHPYVTTAHDTIVEVRPQLSWCAEYAKTWDWHSADVVWEQVLPQIFE